MKGPERQHQILQVATAGMPITIAGGYRSQLIELARRGTAEVLATAGITDPADLEIAPRIWIMTIDTRRTGWLSRGC